MSTPWKFLYGPGKVVFYCNLNGVRVYNTTDAHKERNGNMAIEPNSAAFNIYRNASFADGKTILNSVGDGIAANGVCSGALSADEFNEMARQNPLARAFLIASNILEFLKHEAERTLGLNPEYEFALECGEEFSGPRLQYFDRVSGDCM